MLTIIAILILLASAMLVAMYTPFPQAWMRWAVPVAIVVAGALLLVPSLRTT
jgi:hypothetical protein